MPQGELFIPAVSSMYKSPPAPRVAGEGEADDKIALTRVLEVDRYVPLKVVAGDHARASVLLVEVKSTASGEWCARLRYCTRCDAETHPRWHS